MCMLKRFSTFPATSAGSILPWPSLLSLDLDRITESLREMSYLSEALEEILLDLTMGTSTDCWLTIGLGLLI